MNFKNKRLLAIECVTIGVLVILLVGYYVFQALTTTQPLLVVEVVESNHIEQHRKKASRFDYLLLEMLSARAESPATETTIEIDNQREKILDKRIKAKQLLQRKLQEQMVLGYQLLIALHQSKQSVNKLLNASNPESTDSLKQLQQKYDEQIFLLAEVGAFLGESEVQLMAERLFGEFPHQADALLHRIQAFLGDHGH